VQHTRHAAYVEQIAALESNNTEFGFGLVIFEFKQVHPGNSMRTQTTEIIAKKGSEMKDMHAVSRAGRGEPSFKDSNSEPKTRACATQPEIQLTLPTCWAVSAQRHAPLELLLLT
jgi:hypothetical protein